MPFLWPLADDIFDQFFLSGFIVSGSGYSILDWIPIRIQGFDDKKKKNFC